MRIKLLGLSCLAVAACSSQTRIADDTYLFHEQSKTTVARVGPIYERALKQANETCLEAGYTHLQVLNQDTFGSQFGARGAEVEIEVKFYREGGEDRDRCTN